MRYPSIFINHGGGPMPLLGRQPDLVQNMKDVVTKFLPIDEPPKAIVVVSAHWESNPIRISASLHPQMYYDYYGFPKEAYQFQYPAPGSPELANRIQSLLGNDGIRSQLDIERGYDHGVFIPLMIMYPKADIPVVCVSLHKSLDAKAHLQLGKALRPLRDEGILILGSGYTFHNMNSIMNPNHDSIRASNVFNKWLKKTLVGCSPKEYIERLSRWDKDAGPEARICHPREEHLLPLLVAAAAGGDDAHATLILDTTTRDDEPRSLSNVFTAHAVTGYLFQ